MMPFALRAVPATTDVSQQVLARLAGFTRTLRENAFAIGLKETEDAARVMGSDVASRPTTLRPALKSLFCSRRSDWLKFDDLFHAFWLGRGMRRAVPLHAPSESAARTEIRQLAGQAEHVQHGGLGDQVPRDGGDREQNSGSRGRMEGASRIERLAETDFRKIADPEDIAQAHALAARLAKRMRTRLSRRERARLKGRRIDMRRTIRRNIAHGGAPIELLWRRKKRRPLRLVVLLDASGSMSLYTSLFVRFIHGVLDHFHEAEAFLFHTRLVHVSAAMREKDAGRALERLSLLAQGVGGGTRIGESLATFNRWHAAGVIHSRTCVMIISDGYDTGTPAAMAAEMQRLAKRCRRIVWLNPMIGWDGFEPSARGMQVALPHVDLFAPAHSLASLAALEPYLARL
jgi:uncharacterized protein with von Willebrand factor type A (vWA) domain